MRRSPAAGVREQGRSAGPQLCGWGGPTAEGGRRPRASRLALWRVARGVCTDGVDGAEVHPQRRASIPMCQ